MSEVNVVSRAGSKYLSYQTPPAKTYYIIRGWTLNDEEYKKQAASPQLFAQQYGFNFDAINNEWYYSFPAEFTAPSDHRKYVVFQYCRCCVNDHYPSDLEVHASFIPRDQYCDSLVYYANVQVPDDNRKYQVYCSTKTDFRIWFTNGKGKRYQNKHTYPDPEPEGTTNEEEEDIPDPNEERFNFAIFMKLIY